MSIDSSRIARPLVLLGAGGHAKVLLSLIQAAGFEVLGVCDPVLSVQAVSSWRGIKVLGGDEALEGLEPSSVGLVNGIGQLVEGTSRQRVFDGLKERGFLFPALRHPATWVDNSVILHEGVQVMAGAVIQADTVIGVNSIINTNASVDHDCTIGAHVHIAPAATLCGGVTIESYCFIGSGATVIQGLKVGESSVVGAGVALVRDLAKGHTVLGAAVRKYEAI